MPKKTQMKMDLPPSVDRPSSSSESTSAGKPVSELRGGFAKVPHPTGCAFWGKVWTYGAKLHEGDAMLKPWLSFAIYVNQPKNEKLTVFVNWQDFTWIPEKVALVICQGVPILRSGTNGPYLVLRCYGSKGVRVATHLPS